MAALEKPGGTGIFKQQCARNKNVYENGCASYFVTYMQQHLKKKTPVIR